MKLIVGLGNPGRKYAGTRHNVGFLVLARLADRLQLGRPRAQFEGETLEANIAGERSLLLCPLTYMNRSGRSVLRARDFYKLENQQLLVVCDDFNLPLARLRFRARGSAGGQKGLQSVMDCLGSDEFPRLRVGVGAPAEGWSASGHVLGKFTDEEREPVEQAVDRAADAVSDWIGEGMQYCMNQYNAG